VGHKLGHYTQYHGTITLAKKFGRLEHIIMEAIEVELRPDSLSREEVFSLSLSYKPPIQSLKEKQKERKRENFL